MNLSLLLSAWLLVIICLLPVAPKIVSAALTLLRRRRPNPLEPPLQLSSVESLPFVSVHVATYSEPSEVVIQTLKSFLELDYPSERFEVIVLDNNTTETELWEPVQQWCRNHPHLFRFYHYEEVEGAKAGALNIALELTDPLASIIAAVDADFEVANDFLSRGVHALRDKSITHVQFPQAYRNVNTLNSGIAAELDQYFSNYACQADRSQTMLLTGTLSLIRRSALEEVGGWPTETITEDADLGIRLLEQGGRGRYLSHIAGQGLMPGSLSGLSTQRTRWAAGNVQVLKNHFANYLNKAHSAKISASAIFQLSAWPSFILLLAIPFFSTAVFRLEVSAIFAWALISGLIIETMVASATARGSLQQKLEAGFVRLALLPECLIGSLKALCGFRLSFVRTPKGTRQTRSSALYQYHGIAFGLAMIALFLQDGQVLSAVATLLLTLIPIARYWLNRSLHSEASAKATSPVGVGQSLTTV